MHICSFSRSVLFEKLSEKVDKSKLAEVNCEDQGGKGVARAGRANRRPTETLGIC
jgi:hypothetical protein